MSKEVEIMGGPEDGKLIALRDDVWELKMALPRQPGVMWQESELPPSRDVGYIEVRMPIVRQGGRWYAIYKEPSC